MIKKTLFVCVEDSSIAADLKCTKPKKLKSEITWITNEMFNKLWHTISAVLHPHTLACYSGNS